MLQRVFKWLKKRRFHVVSALVCAVASACGTDGADGRSALFHVVDVGPGANCKGGGVRLESGQDLDGDGALDDDEVQSVEYVCHGATGGTGASGRDGEQGAAGASALVNAVPVPEGDGGSESPCPSGGTKLETGLDADGDGVLSAGEVTSTQYLCNGAAGQAGPEGATGQAGAAALFAMNPEPAGENCVAGGIRVDAGADVDGSGVLDAGEVTSTAYVCDGPQGVQGEAGASALVTVRTEPEGSHCASGGSVFYIGLDANGDGVLQEGEINRVQYLCNGAAGAAGEAGRDGACAGSQDFSVTVSPGGGQARMRGQTYRLKVTASRSGLSHSIVGGGASFTPVAVDEPMGGQYVSTWNYTAETAMDWASFAVVSTDGCRTAVNSFGFQPVGKLLDLVDIPEGVRMPAFRLAKAPVLTWQFETCLLSSHCPVPSSYYAVHDGSSQDTAKCNLGRTGSTLYSGHPMNCVNRNAARLFCQWLGGRLPTAAEWKYAARHDGSAYDGSQAYPWGNGAPVHCVHGSYRDTLAENGAYYCDGTRETSVSYGTASVGYYSPAGDSKLGLQNMSGNVSEWVSDTGDGGGVTCGASFASPAQFMKLDMACDVPAVASSRDPGYGIRCAFDRLE